MHAQYRDTSFKCSTTKNKTSIWANQSKVSKLGSNQTSVNDDQNLISRNSDNAKSRVYVMRRRIQITRGEVPSYYINTSEIPAELAHENMTSLHA